MGVASFVVGLIGGLGPGLVATLMTIFLGKTSVAALLGVCTVTGVVGASMVLGGRRRLGMGLELAAGVVGFVPDHRLRWIAAGVMLLLAGGLALLADIAARRRVHRADGAG